MNKVFAVLFLYLAVTGFQAHAQDDLNPDRDQPLEITADESLEWKRNELIFVARKNALARQGDVSVAAQTLTANYREGKGSGMEIWRVTAAEGVVINTRDSKAFGDQATYDIDKGVAVMTGKSLRMESPDQVVTAKDSFEYWVTDGRLNALGKATVTRQNVKGQTDTLQADKISAVMKDNAKGQRVLHSLEAVNNVIITTPTETVTGAYGIYRAETNTAELTGGVTIKRGPNILQGEKAEVDLNTNTSRIYSDGEGAPGTGRVRGVFYPGSEKKPE